MKLVSKYIFGLTLTGLLAFSSCSNEKEGPDNKNLVSEGPKITLNISPIYLGPASANVTEMISTLRIIMLNEVVVDGVTESYVEFNQFINFAGDPENGDYFSGPGENASSFRYIFTRPTVPGLKKFYLIANEASVGAVNFETDEALPEGVEAGMSLSDFLTRYDADFMLDLEYPNIIPGEGDPKGAEFESLINCLYYTPQYLEEQQTNTSSTSRNVIFLPYTSHYTYELATQEDIDNGNSTGAVNVLDATMYLVPNATKFKFKFVNYRDNEVEIPSLYISGLASDMYLFAQVDPTTDQHKIYYGQNMWWIDWLANVARDSQDYEDATENGSFNSRFGWINNFDIPSSSYPQETVGEYDGETRNGMIQLVVDDEYPVVQGRVSGYPVTGVPGTSSTGYYYFPESRNMVNQPVYDEQGNLTGYVDVQKYNLTLTMRETTMGDVGTTKDTPIGNLNSMFRNTHTIITITMRDSKDVGAYAEPVEWNVTHTNGNVIEDVTPQ